MGQEELEITDKIEHISCRLQRLSWPYFDGDVQLELAECAVTECLGQMQLVNQAQALLSKNAVYRQIDDALQRQPYFHPPVYASLPHIVAEDSALPCAMHRDATVSNLKFLNIFCGNSPNTFALAVNLLDRLLCTVKVPPRYLSMVATCCFHMADKSSSSSLGDGRLTGSVSVDQLLALSQCGCTKADLLMTERQVLDRLPGGADGAVTPLTFLCLFYDVIALYAEPLRQASVLPALVAKLEVLMCQFEFTRFTPDVLALALLSYALQEIGVLNNPDQFALVVELQYYCQMSDSVFMQCRGMIIDYLALYHRQPTRLPRLQLAWSVSRRTLHKMKPSTRVSLDLEPIMEDDVDQSDEDDSGPFDSEADDGGTPTAIKTDLVLVQSHDTFRARKSTDRMNRADLVGKSTKASRCMVDRLSADMCASMEDDCSSWSPDEYFPASSSELEAMSRAEQKIRLAGRGDDCDASVMNDGLESEDPSVPGVSSSAAVETTMYNGCNVGIEEDNNANEVSTDGGVEAVEVGSDENSGDMTESTGDTTCASSMYVPDDGPAVQIDTFVCTRSTRAGGRRKHRYGIGASRTARGRPAYAAYMYD